MIKKILLTGLMMAFVFFVIRNTEPDEVAVAKATVGTSTTSTIKRLAPVDEINNWRSAQPTGEELEQFLLAHQIKVVLRLNGDEVDGSLTVSEEKAICEKNGILFERINAHLSSTDDGGYDYSGEVVAQFLKDGDVYIHCQHGYDRVGAMAGYWLRQIGDTEGEVIAKNNWQNYQAEKGASYIRYFRTVTD